MQIDKLPDIQIRETHLRKRLAHIKPDQFNTREEFLETKNKLQKEFKEVSKKRVVLEQKNAMQDQRAKIIRTKTFIQEHIHNLIIEKDNDNLPIDKNTLTVKVPFTNCKHIRNFSLNDLIPFERERLWQDILQGMAITISRNCEECKKEKQRLLQKFHRRTDQPIGHAVLTIRGLH